MSVPTNSAAPAAPSASSLLRPISSITEWWGYIRSWIIGLSPAGATVHDTQWKDVAIAPGHELSGQKPQVRRIGKVIYFRGGVKPLSGNFTTAALVTVGTAPAEFAPSYWQRSQSVISAGGNVGKHATAQISAAGEIIIRLAPGVDVASVELKNLSGYTAD